MLPTGSEPGILDARVLRRLPALLSGITVFISAFLLFQVQPIIAKIILPWFGGSAAVWTACLLFFQLGLLAGYGYAHLLVTRLKPAAQCYTHVALLLASLAALPMVPKASWKPLGIEDPVLRILGLLTATIGLPYFLLSATSPLLQAWRGREAGGASYRLFALSNAGSMLALITYPFLIEPVLATRHQALGWSTAYLLFTIFCSAAAIGVRALAQPAASPAGDASSSPPRRKLKCLWLALAAGASALLLATTNHISQNLAAIPFLWVLPLSLYLLSFILCFEGRGWYQRPYFLAAAAMWIGGMAFTLTELRQNMDVRLLIGLFAGGLFVCSMVCHGELARLKPPPRYLTSFYLMVSLGGALGGVLVGLVAPHWFRALYEMPVALAICAALILLVTCRDARLWAGELSRLGHGLVWGTAGAVFLGFAGFLVYHARESEQGAVLLTRNFYGALKVADFPSLSGSGAVRRLIHGSIDHGDQLLDPTRRRSPISYYGPRSGIGSTLRLLMRRPNLRVGVVGLGSGSLAVYSRAGDTYRFYEIDPQVVGVARGAFTYLGDTQARIEIALGDARLSLERERPQNFDLLAVDAFSSDSIPIHLLTREAFAVYFKHLKPDGVLAVHVSNKHLDLPPVVALAARSHSTKAMVADTYDEPGTDIFGATWVLIAGWEEFFTEPLIFLVTAPIQPRAGLRVWTDDYSNLFQILR